MNVYVYACTCWSQSVWRSWVSFHRNECRPDTSRCAPRICMCLQWWNYNHMPLCFLVWLFLNRCSGDLNSALCCPFLHDQYLLSKIQCFDLSFLISIINIQEKFYHIGDWLCQTERLQKKNPGFPHLPSYHPHHFYNHNWCQKSNDSFIQILDMNWFHCINLDYQSLLIPMALFPIVAWLVE